MAYPPASHILAVQFFAKREEEAKAGAEEAARYARQIAEQQERPAGEGTRQQDLRQGAVPDTVVIGPAPALIGKINDVYRYGVYVKNKNYEKLVEIKDGIEALRASRERLQGLCQFDFDPVHNF